MKKLVRNLIPDIIPNQTEATFHRASDQDQISYLYAKLNEEIQEFKEQPSDEEMADILEVLDTIIARHSLNKETVLSTQARKKKLRGGFDKYIVGEFSSKR